MHWHTVASCLADLRDGRTRSQALVDEALARSRDPDGEGARVFMNIHETAARESARAYDALRGAGIERSAIDGIPITIKDLFDLKGETTCAGSPALKDQPRAPENSVVVRRLLAAGAVIVGRTTMTEFAYSGLGINPFYGTPRNVWDRKTGRIPGGSSSGAAVSVADGMAVAAIGTDTGGSIRIPAALNGLVGFKPTARRIPAQGVLPLSPSFDTVGPIARSVACCAVLDAVLSGDGESGVAPMPLRGLRFVLPDTVVLDGMDAQVSSVFWKSISRLSEAGVWIDEQPMEPFARLGEINPKGRLQAAEAWAWTRKYIQGRVEECDPRVVSRIRRGEDVSAAEYIELQGARAGWIGEVERIIHPYDAMIMPTVPMVAPAIEELVASDEAYFKTNAAMLRNPSFINFLDGCALSIPCHRAGEAPVGLTLAGRSMDDRRILSMGLAVEELLAPRENC
ncbi:MAG: amidase [Candidatus Accumulibacter sp.]|nr:amidase [Accumulibacter sp.]